MDKRLDRRTAHKELAAGGGASPGLAGVFSEPSLTATLERVRPFTMVPVSSLLELADQVHMALAFDVQGDFVECGVWRGGASFLMADLLRQAGVRDRKVWLLDSFEGNPPPQEVDGPAAQRWAEDTEGPLYYNNLRVSFEEVRRAAADLGVSAYTEFVKGWFEETLPVLRKRIGRIAILRIDCDWYTSVRCCLTNLYDLVVDGGVVVFDDYYTFDGCAIAVHEFLGERRVKYRIENISRSDAGFTGYRGAFFLKGDITWRWRWQVYRTLEEIAALVAPGGSFILVDQGELATSDVVAGRTRIPFLERDGQYWGPPADDETAIRELDRLKQCGAALIAFAWPAFWWLEFYAGFARNVRERFSCVQENGRVIVFDLRPRAVLRP